MKKQAFTLVPLPSFPFPLSRLLVLMISLTILIVASDAAWAQPKSRCQEKVLESGTVEGIFAGIECGDNCHAEIIMDNGETFSLLCGEEEAEQYFGEVGNRVSLDYEIQQYWNDLYDEGYCARHEIVKSGKIIVAGADPALKKRHEEQERAETVVTDTIQSPSSGRTSAFMNGFQLGMDEASFLDIAKSLFPVVVNDGDMVRMNMGDKIDPYSSWAFFGKNQLFLLQIAQGHLQRVFGISPSPCRPFIENLASTAGITMELVGSARHPNQVKTTYRYQSNQEQPWYLEAECAEDAVGSIITNVFLSYNIDSIQLQK